MEEKQGITNMGKQCRAKTWTVEYHALQSWGKKKLIKTIYMARGWLSAGSADVPWSKKFQLSFLGD